MMNFLKLIRYKNLLIILATEYILRYFLILPTLQYSFSPIFHLSIKDQFGELNFFLLSLATILIAAGGFAINDYFDRKTDMMNRPDKIIIGKHIHRRTAMTIHLVTNIIGIALGFYISWKIGFVSLGMIFLFVSGLLWFYSTNFNNEFLIGNIIVSILTAMIPFLVALYEMVPLNIYYKNLLMSYNVTFNNLTLWLLFYSFFAFMLTLPREILKDMEDMEGDWAYGRNSVPIKLGMFASKIIVVILFAITIISLPTICILKIQNTISTIFLTATVSLPLIWLSYKTIKAQTVEDYHFIQTANKVIMLCGLAYLILLSFIVKGLI